MLQQVQRYGEQFLNATIESKIKVFEHDHSSISKLNHLAFSEEPKSLTKLLELLYETVDTTGINPAAPSHFGYVPGGGIYPAALGDYLVDITNRYAGISFANPGAVRMENILLEWVAEMVGYPKTATGNLASGGSIASLIAIVSARDHHGINPENVRKSVVYCTSQIHHCLLKSFRIAGLDYLITRHISVDHDYAMNPESLEKALKADVEAGLNPFLILASAGSTDVGVIDPLQAIGLLARKYDCWFHVDAAYGGFFMLVDNLKEKFDGMELSDSVVIDPHKGLFLPYGTGAVLVKERSAVVRSHHYRANYMQDAFQDQEDISPADVSPELTKHFRGLRMWLPLQLIGLAPFKAALEEKIYLCRYFYQKVQELGFEVGPDPMLSVCLFRWTNTGDPDRYNQLLLEQIQKTGSTFISSTTIDNTFWLRVCIMVFRTHLEHVDQFLLELAEMINQDDFNILEARPLDN
jgi:glutamate/tyrosine decarboxylase-like PLP-dependent enzyme